MEPGSDLRHADIKQKPDAENCSRGYAHFFSLMIFVSVHIHSMEYLKFKKIVPYLYSNPTVGKRDSLTYSQLIRSEGKL
ncbi:MAG: hypothetical protein CVV33_05650 [Methanomicrobiales archaeon HGW-Methanomicrobiales-4]|nr:MAG: hypothetical protein CVV33_05650 [Methanomicrobiales archaeon HGW-Methanomicrobiales-4]